MIWTVMDITISFVRKLIRHRTLEMNQNSVKHHRLMENNKSLVSRQFHKYYSCQFNSKLCIMVLKVG